MFDTAALALSHTRADKQRLRFALTFRSHILRRALYSSLAKSRILLLSSIESRLIRALAFERDFERRTGFALTFLQRVLLLALDNVLARRRLLLVTTDA